MVSEAYFLGMHIPDPLILNHMHYIQHPLQSRTNTATLPTLKKIAKLTNTTIAMDVVEYQVTDSSVENQQLYRGKY